MSTLKPIKSTYPTGSQFLSHVFANLKLVKSRGISDIAKLLLITSVLLFGYNLSFAQPGSLDTSFDPGTAENHLVLTTSLQSDGKIIIGGEFNSYNGTAINGIARLHPDGSLDTSFDPGTGITGRVITTLIQSDGKIIIGGQFISYNGMKANYIARLNPDGSLDTSFDLGVGPNSTVRSASLQSDGKIIIGGDFTSYNGTAMNRTARLNTDGSLDTSFNSWVGAEGRVYTISLQSDGKIIIGGWLGIDNGMAIDGIARLNTDGSLDTTFDPGPGRDSWVNTTSLQSDGKILIGGWVTTSNGTGRKGIARLNTDGSFDTSFDPGTGPDYFVYTTSVQSDGKIIIGGDFTSYNGTPINNIARIYSTTSTSVNPPLEEESKIVKIFPNPFSNTATLHSDIQLKNAALTIFNSIGQTVKQITAINIGAGNNFTLNRDQLPTGLYFIQLSQDNQVIMNDKLVITD